MDQKLHLLESFPAIGGDGAKYKVMGYERLRRDESVTDGQDHWAPTGIYEFRLDSGELVDVHKDGKMTIGGKGTELKRA